MRKTPTIRTGDKRASIARIKAELKRRSGTMKPRTQKAILHALAKNSEAQLKDLWQRWGKLDFTWVDEVLFNHDKKQIARQKQDAFLELFRQAINSGEGFWSDHIPALYSLIDAAKSLKYGQCESARNKQGSINARRIFGWQAQDAESALRDALANDLTIPLEVIEGFSPTLEHIINERAKFDRVEAQEEARATRRAKKSGKR
jgi:hypothetical protein